jgi:hypothetical protein
MIIILIVHIDELQGDNSIHVDNVQWSNQGS